MENPSPGKPDPTYTELSQFDRADRICDAYERQWLDGQRPRLEDFLCMAPADQHVNLRRELEAIQKDYESQRREADSVTARRLGDYRIVRELGRGGMGIVYEAEQVSLGRHVALKVLPKELLYHPKHRSRFEREAKAAAKLHHTNIVPVFGVGEDNGQSYYVMQFIHGLALNEVLSELNRLNFRPGSSIVPSIRDLPSPREAQVSATEIAHSLATCPLHASTGNESPSQRMQVDETVAARTAGSSLSSNVSKGSPTDSRLSDTFLIADSSSARSDGMASGADKSARPWTYWRRVAMIGVQVASALEYAHGQGILHRDVKPANLLLDKDGMVWITDFGLAKLEDERNLTQTGDILGTLRYMAPESFKGHFDARSEIYSLGLTLYELLTLRPAYDQKDKRTLVEQVMNAQIAPLGEINRQIPVDLQTIVHKAIDRDPQHRYRSAGELADDLQRFVDDEPIKARRISLSDRLRRWSRRNKGLATSLGVVATLLLVINIAGPLVTLQMARLNSKLRKSSTDLDIARIDAERKATDNLRLAREAEAARRDSVTMLADLQTEHGILAGEDGSYATAAIWFASAAQLTPHDPDRQLANRVRARNWLSKAMVPVGLLKLPSGSRPKMAFQPDGRLLLTWNTSAMRIWDWQLDQALPWTESLSGVTDASWSPDGSQIAVALGRNTVELREVRSGRIIRSLRHPESVETILWSPDEGRIAVAGSLVQVWNIAADPLLEHSWPHPDRVYGLTFNRAGDRLATACDDGMARLFAVTGNPTLPEPLFAPVEHRTLQHTAPVFCDSDRQLVTSSATQPRWWNVDSGKEVKPNSQLADSVANQSLAVSRDGRWVVTAEDNQCCELWNVDGDVQLLKCNNIIHHLAYDPSGLRLLMTGYDRDARLWSLPPSTDISLPVPRFDTAFATCAFSTDGRFAAIGGNTQATVWQMPSDDVVLGQIECWNRGHYEGALRPRVGFDGRLATQGMWHNGISGSPTATELNVVRMVDGSKAGHTISLDGVLSDSCLCANPRLVAAATVVGTKGVFSLYDIATGKAAFPSFPLPAPAISVAPRPRKSEVAVLCQDGQLLVIDTENGSQRLEISHEGWSGQSFCAHVQYSPDGNALIAVTPSSQVFVREAATGRMRFPPINPVLKGGPCRDLAISPDSRRMATAVNNVDTVQVWDLNSGERVGTALPHPTANWGIFSVEFSPDGRQILTAHSDRRLRLWDWKTGKLIIPPMLHSNEVYDGQFTASGRYAVTAVRQGTVQVWDLKTGELAAAPLRFPQPWGISNNAPSTFVLGVAGSYIIAAGAGYDTLLDVSSLIDEQTADSNSLQRLAELSADEMLQLGKLTRFQDSQWDTNWNEYQKPQPVALVRQLDQSPDSTSRQMVARRAARFGLLSTLVKLRPEVPELHLHLAQENSATGDADSAMKHYERAIAILNQKLSEEPTNEIIAGMLADTLLARHQQGWTVLKPTQVKSEGGATLTVQKDGSTLASGTNARTDTYVVLGDPGSGPVTVVRLELLPHESLPYGGPGRYPGNGNAVLSEIELAIVDDTGKSVPIHCREAHSDHELLPAQHYAELHTHANNLIDLSQVTRWESWPKQSVAHAIDLQLSRAVVFPPGSRLQIRLCNSTDEVDSSPGCFRLSVTGDPAAPTDPWTRLAVAFASIGDTQRSVETFRTALDTGGSLSDALHTVEAALQYPDVFAELLLTDHPAFLIAQLRRLSVNHVPASAEAREHTISALENYLEAHPNAELASLLADEILSQVPDDWTVLVPTNMTSDNGTTMTAQADGSLLASREPEENETYVVTGRAATERISALRLEALPHSSMRGSGPGWGAGNFHLTQVRAFVQRSRQAAVPLKFRLAAADHTRAVADGARLADGPMATIDGSHETTWDIWPHPGKLHWLILVLEEPVDVAESDSITVKLDFRDSRWPKAKLGCFRLSSSAAEMPHLLELR